MKKTLITLLFLLSSLSFSQQGKGIITGVVKDLKTGQPIKDVLVRISQLKLSKTTNELGEFSFNNLEPGAYTLRLFHKHYNTLKIPHQEVFANSAISLPINMIPGGGEGEGNDTVFFIGGMEVIAKKNVLPDKVLTTTEISSGQIEHLQASSLGDVMQLIPGVGQMNPGLGEKSILALRGVSSLGVTDATSQNTMFGTKIMVDGSNISNNASMNNIVLNSNVAPSAGSGVDLRGIPADNIESVEVLRGVASAKYGDFTEGVVLVKTKSGYQPQRAKVKINPNTNEFNFNGGVDILEGMGINYNFNLASSVRDIRREGDSYERLAGQVKLSNSFYDDKSLNISNGFYYTRLFDDYKDVKDPVNGPQSYNHSYSIRYNNEVVYKLSNLSKIEFRSTLSYGKEDRFRQDMLKGTAIDSRYVTNTTVPGTYQLVKVFGGYVYQSYEKGNVWNFNAEGEWSRKAMKTGSLIHNLSAGINYQYDDKTGPGFIFDPNKPPQKDKRPFPYDAVPANNLLSVYAEDEMHGVLFKPFTLSFGLRYDMFSPESIDWKGLTFTTDFVKSRSGSFLQPRVSFRYFISSDTRVRFAYGRNAKSPALNTIFPPPAYVDLRDYYNDARDNSDTVLYTTYVFNRTYLNARGYAENKFELSLDQKITDDIGITLRGYYSYRDNELISHSSYLFVPIMNRPNFPGTGGESIRSYSPISYSEYYNDQYARFRGLDLIITTQRIEAINSSFYIAGSYGYSEGGEMGGVTAYKSAVKWSTLDSLKKLYHTGDNLIPVYLSNNHSTGWDEKVMFTYRWEFTVRKLGLWVTLAAQQVVYVKSKSFSSYDDHAVGYLSDIDGGKYSPYSADVPQDAKFRTYYLDTFTQPITDTWTFNLNVSKSLYKGAEISFFVNSFLDRFNNIFYGLEFSMDANRIF